MTEKECKNILRGLVNNHHLSVLNISDILDVSRSTIHRIIHDECTASRKTTNKLKMISLMGEGSDLSKKIESGISILIILKSVKNTEIKIPINSLTSDLGSMNEFLNLIIQNGVKVECDYSKKMIILKN